MNVHLIDVVSGGVVSTITHRRVRGPVNIIHSENWLVYTYYNDKVRRTELSMSWVVYKIFNQLIYLHCVQLQPLSNYTKEIHKPIVPFGHHSMHLPYLPLSNNRTSFRRTWWHYRKLLPKRELLTSTFWVSIDSIIERFHEVTLVEKNNLNSPLFVAVGLSSGGIVEMPWHLLDPRRPVLGNNQPREEGTIPYMPELPLSSESIINYNKSISRPQGIYSAPSGLESTCLVVAYGLGESTDEDWVLNSMY